MSVHEGDGVTGVRLLNEGHKAVTFGLQGLGITHHSAVTTKNIDKKIIFLRKPYRSKDLGMDGKLKCTLISIT